MGRVIGRVRVRVRVRVTSALGMLPMASKSSRR